MPKKVLIALPAAMLEQCDYIAQAEHRTRSDMIREALRRYMAEFSRCHHLPAPTPALLMLHPSPISPPLPIAPITA